MNYRITIETEKAKDERGYTGWEQVYQQTVPDMNVKTLVTHINSSRVRKRGRQQHEVNE